ncbi:MliC family protein [Devosia rhodophyticola]|uniref:MliC family protein n=1 Tax=Devosia rhodophyticola TaxID=3026423 RepID=A0ABY7YVA4_9HYPH|nr:MliC family protein [Devosia rhodophyticola]WDR05298.1 MliC family protein [Devosia rhodophyticola]
MSPNRYHAVAVSLFLTLSTPGAHALSATITLNLGIEGTGTAEQRAVQYACDKGEPFEVTYVNAAPNYLALLPIDGKQLLMREVISASGAKYVADVWVWWTKGSDAQLYDLRDGPDAAPIDACYEVTDAP